MVRAQPEKKVQSDRKKGTEPRSKEKKNTGNTDSPSVRKKYFKELPGGILPKAENPKPDDVNEEAKLLLQYERQLQRNAQRELIPNYGPYPERRTYGIKSPANSPPTEGKGNDPPYGSYFKGVCAWIILFSVFMTFIISPWTALAWVALQTVSFLSLNECRTQVRDFSMRIITNIVNVAYHKVHSVRKADTPGGGEQGYYTSTPECLKLNVTAKGKFHSYMQRKLARQDALWNQDIGLLHITPERDDVEKATHFNFKIKCRINTDNYVVAEIDTDSHLNLISSKYFEKIKNRGGGHVSQRTADRILWARLQP
jgi:hypothetical protein